MRLDELDDVTTVSCNDRRSLPSNTRLRVCGVMVDKGSTRSQESLNPGIDPTGVAQKTPGMTVKERM